VQASGPADLSQEAPKHSERLTPLSVTVTFIHHHIHWKPGKKETPMRLPLRAFSLAAVSFAAVSATAWADDDLQKDLAGMQGVWEGPAHPVEPGILRITKEIKGNVETVTAYGEGGKLLRKHRNPFKLSRSGDVRVWTATDVEILEGPQKGTKSRPDFSYSYIYRLDGDTLYEAQGLLAGDEAKNIRPALYTWKRKKSD
jgi:hypothetical protein